MKPPSLWWVVSSTILLSAFSVHAFRALVSNDNNVKFAEYLSPSFVLGPGSVQNKYYYNIDFPRGHIALKEFNAEVVDESGNSVPLHETYLHHWTAIRYYAQISSEENPSQISVGSKTIVARNSGTCQGVVLGQYFGLGSETRHTSTFVPNPYGIEVGNPKEIPDGYEERWILNVHAIDTRGVVDRIGCTECKCDLYNITVAEYEQALLVNYTGGLYCCYDQTQCRVRDGFKGIRRKLYMRYTVKWVDWDQSIVPARIYISDVTDTGKRTNSTKEKDLLGCQTEYQVESCNQETMANGGCIHNKKTQIVIPRGGDLVYGVAHQHAGGTGTSLYGQDGRLICASMPRYGKGREAGNEAGYIVGMSACYPKPGSVRIADEEILTFESIYDSSRMHTGVMGLSYILVVDSLSPEHKLHLTFQTPHETFEIPKYSWALFFMGVALALVIGISYLGSKEKEEGYQSIVM